MCPHKFVTFHSRREFLKQSAAAAMGLAGLNGLGLPAFSAPSLTVSNTSPPVDLTLSINQRTYPLRVDSRSTLLDLLRETIGLTGTKKGCDRGECGACTVHVDGQRVLSCMTLAVMADGRAITTIEGIASGEQLHPVQAAFIEHDAFQCGYCTSGQIMSGIACIREGHAESAEELSEFMSGNLCRCAAYPQIRAALLAVAKEKGAAL